MTNVFVIMRVTGQYDNVLELGDGDLNVYVIFDNLYTTLVIQVFISDSTNLQVAQKPHTNIIYNT